MKIEDAGEEGCLIASHYLLPQNFPQSPPQQYLRSVWNCTWQRTSVLQKAPICPKEFARNFMKCQETVRMEEREGGRQKENLGKKMRQYSRNDYLGSLGDLLARLILGDFFAAQSSLSSISLESEQLQLSITVEIKLFP